MSNLTPHQAAERLASINIISRPALTVSGYDAVRHPWRTGPYRALKSFSLPNPIPNEPDRVSFMRGDTLMLDGWEPVEPAELIRKGYMEEVHY